MLKAILVLFSAVIHHLWIGFWCSVWSNCHPIYSDLIENPNYFHLVLFWNDWKSNPPDMLTTTLIFSNMGNETVWKSVVQIFERLFKWNKFCLSIAILNGYCFAYWLRDIYQQFISSSAYFGSDFCQSEVDPSGNLPPYLKSVPTFLVHCYHHHNILLIEV